MITGKAKVSSKGWVVIPKEIRDVLGISPGDEVRFVFWPARKTDKGETGRLSVLRVSHDSLAAQRGMFKHLRGAKPITEELVEERRAEVDKEEREIRDWKRKRRTTA